MDDKGNTFYLTPEGNRIPVSYTHLDSEVLKLNSGFFTQTFEGDPTDIDEYRQQRQTGFYC